MAIIIDGKKIAADIRHQLAIDLENIKSKFEVMPGLAVVIVGDNPASRVYVNNKKKACEEVGIKSFEFSFPETISEEVLLEQIDKLNEDKAVHGILVQLPLPGQIDEKKILQHINSAKDVDGFHPLNVGKMLVGKETFLPCTPFGIQKILEKSNISTEGKHVVIVGRSNIVGKPMAAIFLQYGEFANATVTVCHSKTKNMGEITRQGDIVIVAIGKPNFLKIDMIKEGATVIDVGINRVCDEETKKGRLVGDVDFENVKEKAGAITPVPGGVGPMTITMLLYNTVLAALWQNELEYKLQ